MCKELKQRNPNIELYRCLLTFGIVLLHVVGFYGGGKIRLSSGLDWCVPGFIFISGYFGMRFSWKKLLKIYGVALWCYPVSALMCQIVDGSGLCITAILKTAYESFLWNWFVHAYVGLMLLAPLVDGALVRVRESGRLKDAALLLPFLIFVFGWSFLSDFNCTHKFIPLAPSCSVLTLLGVYAVARIFRFCKLENRISTLDGLILFAVSLSLAFLKIGKFNSIIALAITIGSFVVFLRMKLPRSFGRFVLVLAPSMFSVFLMHAIPWVLHSVKEWVGGLMANGLPLYVSFVALALVVFVAGVLLDLPRRVLVKVFHGQGI